MSEKQKYLTDNNSLEKYQKLIKLLQILLRILGIDVFDPNYKLDILYIIIQMISILTLAAMGFTSFVLWYNKVAVLECISILALPVHVRTIINFFKTYFYILFSYRDYVR